MTHSPFREAFTAGARFDDGAGIVEVMTRVIGELKVPTGRIVVSDPFTTSFETTGTPLRGQAPTGLFPVEVAIARFDNGDERLACARVRFRTDVIATRWEVASFEGDPPPVGGAIPGYGVDAGMGCFFDEAACGGVDEGTNEAWLTAAGHNQVDTWTWHVADLGQANVVMFSSGWGDGFYGSWWGYDAAGSLIELVTDFDVLTNAVPS